MAVDLIYKHQQKTYELMNEALKEDGRAAYIFPVGCGKSFPILKYMEDHPNETILYVSPNLEIINQMKQYISKYLLDGKPVNRKIFPNFIPVTYQKLSLLNSYTSLNPDVIVFDEVHRMGAEVWEQGANGLISSNPNAKIIGMSATPERTDKRNIAYEKFGEDVVYEMSLTEALSGEKEGEVVLKGARYVRVLSELKGYAERLREGIEVVDNPKRKGILLQKYKKLQSIISALPDVSNIMQQSITKKNGKYLVFCSNKQDMFEKMKHANEIFGQVNDKINISYVISKDGSEGNTPIENRKVIENFEDMENGDSLNLLFCVDILNEGRHIEGVDGEVMFRPTDSKVLYKQLVGRVLSADKEAEETVIIDVVNNWLRQMDTFLELEHAIQSSQSSDKKSYELVKLSEDELELVDLLKSIGEDLRYNSRKTYNEIVEWLKTHDGNMPKGAIIKNKRTLIVSEMTEDEQYEVNLYRRWKVSAEKRVLEECVGIPIDELPERYHEFKKQIETLRSYGLGLKQKTPYEELIEWLETHGGNIPKGAVVVNGKRLPIHLLTDNQRKEVNLYDRWRRSQEKKVLDACIDISLDELPEEYQQYKEQIETLRSYGLGLKQKTSYEELIEWLETHEGNMPRGNIARNGKKLRKVELTEEEASERDLYDRWRNSQERKVLDACIGISLDELPEEYQQHREQIETLRSYGLGLEQKTPYEELVEWLGTHEGNMPRSTIIKNGNVLRRADYTEEEAFERALYDRWRNSQERKVLDACIGISLDELPEEYQPYKEQIETLRSYGLGLKQKTPYEELVEWLKAHNGQMPRGTIQRDGKRLRKEERTPEENFEAALYKRWKVSPEKRAFDACKGIPLDELPKEFADFKEKIELLRQFEEMRRANELEKRMKKSVSRHVADNEQTRKDLKQIQKELKEEENNK